MRKVKLWSTLRRTDGAKEKREGQRLGERPAPPPNSPLCDQCQPWGDLEFLKGYQGPKSEALRRSSTLEELSQNHDCLVCRAVATAVHNRRQNTEALLKLLPSDITIDNGGASFLDTGQYTNPDTEEIPNRFDASSSGIINVRLIIHIGIMTQNDDTSKLTMTPQFCLQYASTHGSPTLTSIEPWETPFLDIPLLKLWIRGCKKVHGRECSANSNGIENDLPGGFRVIDVNSMRVVKKSKPVNFVALSYMWQIGNDDGHLQLEKNNLHILEVAGGLENIGLPMIISDAIELCQNLGKRYLWVDRLCIVQDDASSKHSQICSMDTIYGSASVTIFVALNERDGRGIPGSRSRSRDSSIWQPPRNCANEARGINPQGMKLVNSSLWNNRGWTFQERVLSRRRIFITDSQVIYECAGGQAHEELACYSRFTKRFNSRGILKLLRKSERHEERNSRIFPGFIRESTYGEIDYNLRTDFNFSRYCHWIQDYTSRKLSYRSDILNAFAGVNNSIEKRLNSVMVFGLPERYIAQSLMWKSRGHSNENAEFLPIPSWSWASALQKVDYFWLNGNSTSDEDMENTISLIYFYFQDPDLGFRKLDAEERWDSHLVSIKKVTANEELPALSHGKYIPADKRSNRTWKECPQNPWQLLNHLNIDCDARSTAAQLPGSLIFNTTVASLRLECSSARDTNTDQNSAAEDASLSNEDYTEQYMHVLNDRGEAVGYLTKRSPEWISAYANRVYEFIAIGGSLEEWRSRKTMAQYMRNYDMWRLHVMLIERVADNPYAVRRVDVGIIRAHQWKDCDPRWETIVLC